MTAAFPAPVPDAAEEREVAPAEGKKYIWEGQFGTITIEVRDGRVFVDGVLVEHVDGAPAQVGRSDASNTVEAMERPAA